MKHIAKPLGVLRDCIRSKTPSRYAHFLLDADGIVVYRDFLNMERFDARATHVRAALDDLLGATA